MPPSQLKQLKASLRESGVLGPQQSKKQKRQNAKTGAAAQNRNQRNAALQAIRDRFNPFEIKTTATKRKFDVTTRDAGKEATVRARPGVTKSLGEEKRRQTLLRELHMRNKVGGIHDRRFGEDDPNMTPEEKAAERFARESQRKMRKDSMFNLEDDDDDDDEDFQLTHKGQTLSFGDGMPQDDFEERDLGDAEEDDMSDSEFARKRKRLFDGEDDGELEENDGPEDEDEPERKKSKHEVMKEVIAKSKFYKYERQKAKEDDDELREELDKGLPDLFDMLRGVKPPPKPEPPKDDLAIMNPDRAALLEGKPRDEQEKEYDQRLKQLTFDKRSAPTDRTKTAEEKAEEEAQRLKKLEEERLRRMRGEEISEDEEEESEEDEGSEMSEDESIPDDAKAFGLQAADHTTTRPELGVEDEDDFIIDDDLVETRSDVSLSIDESDVVMSDEEDSEEEEQEEEDELINGLTLPAGKDGEVSAAAGNTQDGSEGLAYTYPCPGSHDEFLQIIDGVPMQDLPTVIQRIRALHHPRLHADNKTKLGRFAAILVEHVVYMTEQPERPPFAIVENTLRHIHSLAKTHPESVSQAFRAQLREMARERPLALRPSDLVVLTGVAAIFPTSDHFHAVATPAHLCIARYLGQGAIDTLADFATGVYAASLFLQYQTMSKRYMPEFMNYVLNALCNLAPVKPKSSLGLFPSRAPEEPLRLQPSKKLSPRKLRFWDVAGPASGTEAQELKLSLITTMVNLLDTASDLWADKSAFTEIFEPAQNVLRHVRQSCEGKVSSAVTDSIQSTLDKIDQHLSKARKARRPLLLHNHRPLAIKSAIPKFEESFNPDKHYDPNRERAEANRLKTELKRERKGAMRELRKDANFIAREQLREKKERDAEYERKYKRLVAEVQNQEGREAKAYEKEKRMRQGKR